MTSQLAQTRPIHVIRNALGQPAALRIVPDRRVDDAYDPGWRYAALQRSDTAEERCDPARLWSALCSGRLVVGAIFRAERRTLAVLTCPSEDGLPRATIHGRRRAVLEAVLAGYSEKAIAIDLGFSGATISAELHAALQTLGLPARLSRVPLFLSQVCNAATAGSPLDATWARLDVGDAARVVVAVSLPDPRQFVTLTSAEIGVCRLLLDGRTHAEIAVLRSTKPRTISNQISSIFKKLRVSGRMALMATLVRRDAAPGARAGSSSDEIPRETPNPPAA